MDPFFSEKLSHHARRIFETAERLATESGTGSVRPVHLLSGILSEDGSLGNLLLVNAGIRSIDIGPGSSDSSRKPAGKSISLSTETKDLLVTAFRSARQFGSPYVGTEHIVHAVLSRPDRETKRVLDMAGIDRKRVVAEFETHLGPDRIPDFAKLLDFPIPTLSGPRTDRNGLPPALSQYATDLGRESSERGEAFFGRETEMERIVSILGRKQKNNPVLLGEPGVGKTAIVSALATRIGKGEVGSALAGKRILALDLALVVAGTNFRGEFEARIKEIVREAKEHPDIILFIDELHTIVGAGNTQGGLDAANILKPALARGEIRVIGATTPAEYRRHIEKDPALGRRFQPVSVREPSVAETKHLLRAIRPAYESFHGVSIANPVLDLAVDLSVRHLHDRFLPDKAIDILDEAASLLRNRSGNTSSERTAAALESARKNIIGEKELLLSEGRLEDAAAMLEEELRIGKEIGRLSRRNGRTESKRIPLSEHDLLETVAAITGIPLSTLERDRPEERLARLGRALRNRIAFQEDAVEAIESALLRALSGIRDPERPLGSLLFLGPTGVGKTLAAKTVAEEFFGGSDRLIRLDMSEYMERHSVAQMIGAPAGYVGYGEGGRLTERIRRTPHAIVLFDEIDKAHPDVANVLLQILDEGMLTDADGRKVSFRDALVVITSNAGTGAFLRDGRIGFGKESGTDHETASKKALEELRTALRPELLARIDRTVVFGALGRDAIRKIVRLETGALRKRLAKNGVSILVPDSVITFLADRSQVPEQGARLVRRNVEEFVERPIARTLMSKPTVSRRRLALSVRDGAIRCIEQRQERR
ncbi:MAG: ATP-dependent Clp protease ATP-binding subunit [Candidatus Moranbacteria bacterium]|nr:ATP-dependent Clp protease ATP-binding subunit [Candidatus Moranbacteria bacterium]